MSDVILINFRKEKLTMRQVLAQVKILQERWPFLEIFMDGDAYAIVGRARKVMS
ncbi:hypothetical protein PED39_05235 [Methanomassiliicoccales archaeon LGM-RCC1]|nr:hypothetical protein PED39_05235 [Methanomassiliicoccales archaeon LGM-RCC1]